MASHPRGSEAGTDMRLYTVICTCSSCPQECHAWSLENGALAGIGITLGPAHLDPISCDTQRLTVSEKKTEETDT